MKKMKKTFICSFGAFISFLFTRNAALAQIIPVYGVSIPVEEPTLGEKTLSVILSPIFMISIAVLVLITGIIVFIKQKRKNAKNNS